MTRSELTVVLSRWPEDDPDKQRREQEVADALRGAGYAHLTAVPHLYYLRPEDPVVQALRATADDLVVLAWLYPRAMEWILHQDGILSGPDRRVLCFDLRTERDATQLADEIRQAGGAAAVGGARVTGVDADRTVARRWYPVLDYERCSNCLECIDFCLFGVYGLDEAGHVFVENADACKTDCPACSRVCQLDAIIFPECPTPLIAGAPDRSAGFDERASGQAGSVVALTVGGDGGPRAPAGVTPGDKHQQSAGEDRLDALIDELEGLNP